MTPAVGVATGLAAAKAAAEYYLERQVGEATQRTAAYYAQNERAAADAIAAGQGCAVMPRADMVPEVAAALALDATKPVGVGQLTNLLAGLRADGAEIEGSQRGVRAYKAGGPGENDRHRIAYLDLTLSAPKSVSVAWAFAETEAERASILEAHKTAVAETLRYVEEQVGWARSGKGGEGPLERARFGWLSLEHFTSRPTLEMACDDPTTGERYTALRSVPVAGDPQLHSHNLIPSVMVTGSGRVVALNTALLPGRYHEFGAVYDGILGRELNKLGMHTDLDPRTNKLRLTAIPQSVCDEFSKRTRDGETAARDLARRVGRDWEAMDAAERADLIKLETHRARRDKESNTPDLDAWRRQAERIGWRHRSAVAHGPAAPARSRAERMDAADRVGLAHLADMLGKDAVLDQGDVRLAIARGFIAEGMESTDDMNAMARHWATATVMQDGEETRLAWRVVENGRVKLTTELHRAREDELVALARAAGADRTHALASGEVAAAVGRSGLVFRGEHGDAQRGAIEVLGTDGGLAVAVGVAGAGKSALLSPLVAAWQARGYTVWGAADANTQATKLTEAGIEYVHTRAVKPLLDSLNGGRAALDRNSVLVLDELGRIGTRELLQLLRDRERIGFKLVAVGDDRQCSAIEAGSVVDLLREALGEERIPEILSTIRQQSEREREIAGLFRKGEVAQAVAAKREDGTAELVEGGYRQAVERVADLWEERHRATHNRPDYRITISAPTNGDAREIGRAVRERRRALGEVTGPDHERRATDGRGDAYVLDLARGDDVRLFRRTRAVFTDEQGRRRSSNIGDNGSVLRIEAVLPAEGLVLRTESGKAGFVSWRELEDRATGRTLLTWGSCLTIDAAQGLTSDEHINALPGGSRAVTGRKAYVAASRHRVASYLVGSAGAELRQERERRPRGVPEPATAEERQRAAWANLVRNLGKSGAKENATALLERSSETRRSTVAAFQAGLRTREAREAAGQKPVVLREKAERRAVRAALPRVAEAIEQVAQEQAAVAGAAAATVRAMSATVRPTAPPTRRARITELEAQQQLHDAMRAHGLKPQGMPVMDGTLRYVAVEGNRGREKSGAYQAYYDDGWPSAAMWNWKRGGDGGFAGTWTADAEAVPMSAAEQAALARQQAERAAARERERQAREDAGAAKAEAVTLHLTVRLMQLASAAALNRETQSSPVLKFAANSGMN